MPRRVRLERAFGRFAASIETLLRQHAGLTPVPWQGALRRMVTSDFGPYAWKHRERIAWSGASIAVPPLDLQLAASRRRGLVDRVRVIERFIQQPRA